MTLLCPPCVDGLQALPSQLGDCSFLPKSVLREAKFGGSLSGAGLPRAAATRGLLGWLHSVRGVALEDLSLRSAVPGAERDAVRVAFDYLQWLHSSRGISTATEALVRVRRARPDPVSVCLQGPWASRKAAATPSVLGFVWGWEGGAPACHGH
jgi:hypothetical protein